MVETKELKYNIEDFIENMHPNIFSWHEPQTIHNLWTFSSDDDDEEDVIFERFGPDEAETGSRIWGIKDRLREALRLVEYTKCSNVLIQFWEPIITSRGRPVLKSSNHPFALHKVERGLCQYRKYCSTLEFDVFPQDENVGDNEFGFGTLIARVLKQKESSCMYHHTKHQTESDFAHKCGLGKSFILPLFASHRKCVGVLELVDTSTSSLSFDDLQDLALCITEIKESIEEDSVATDKINKAMQVICTAHQLPLALFWSCCSSFFRCSHNFSSLTYNGKVLWFDFACRYRHLIKEFHGITNLKIFQSRPYFSNDVTKLGFIEYPLALDAAFCGLNGCYAICIHNPSSSTHTCDYVLEFYLPPNWDINSGDQQSSFKLLLATMKEQLRFLGFKIRSVVEVPFLEELFLVGPFLEEPFLEIDPLCIDYNEEGEGDDADAEGATAQEQLQCQGSKVSSVMEELFQEDPLYELLWSEGGNRNDLGDEVKGKEAIQDDDTTLGLSLTLELSGIPSDLDSAIETVTEKSYAVWTTGAADQKEPNVLVAEKNNVAAVSYSQRTCREEASAKQRSCNSDPGPLLRRNQPIPEPVETEIVNVQSEEMNEEAALCDIDIATGPVLAKPVREHQEMELSDDSNALETRNPDESNVLVADQNNVAPTIVGRAKTSDGEHGTVELSRCDPKQHVRKELDFDGDSRGVRMKGLKVAIAEASSASVAPSRRKKSSRADNTDEVYRVKDIPITREALLERKHLNREEAAKSLGVKKTSFQLACRHFGIMRWPPEDIVNNAAYNFHMNNVNEKEVVAKKRKKVNSSCSIPLLMNTVHPTSNVRYQKDGETIATYLSYRDVTFAFLFPISSSLPHFREMLCKRCSLNEGLFDIKYRDNKSKLISIVVEDDLEEFITTLRSLGDKSPDIELMVLPISSQAQ